MVKKEKDDFLAAQGFAAANCLIRVLRKRGKVTLSIATERHPLSDVHSI